MPIESLAWGYGLIEGPRVDGDGGLVISGRNICHVRDGVTRVVFAEART